MAESHYALIVIGSGQSGTPLASAFAKAGRPAALIERAELGGTCVNWGCTPTKTMIASARTAYVVGRAEEYGVRAVTSGVDMTRIRQRKREIVQTFRGSAEQGLGQLDRLEIVRGAARLSGDRRVTVVDARGREIVMTADLVVINTGTRVHVPPVAGLTEIDYLDSTSVMELDHVPDHLLILGGGYIGLEFGQMFRRLGSAVTIVQRRDQLLPREDADVAEAVRDVLVEDGIDVRLNAEARQVRAGADGGVELDIEAEGERLTLRGSHLLVAAGRRPNTDDLAADVGGVELDPRGYVRVDDRLATSAEGVYATGDVTGGPQFTHTSYDDYRVLRENLLDGGHADRSGRVLGYTVFIDPQLGRAGLTEREAEGRGLDYVKATMPMSRVARALECDETRGMMKALVERRSGRILGAAVLGMQGGELSSMIHLAMIGGMGFEALRDAPLAHPTLAESLNNLFALIEV